MIQYKNNYLIVKPKYGLCNQLMCIANGIILGLISNRDIFFSSFQIDYKNTDNICNFHDIIDIEYLQQKLNDVNISINIYSDINIKGELIETNQNIDISDIKDIIPLLFTENNINKKFLDINSPISVIIQDKYANLKKYINLHIKFIDKFINIANIIKKKLNLTNYISLHLRLEDDAIQFLNIMTNNKYNFDIINNICKEIYLNELELLKDYNIYICTSLIINNNTNNEFYNEIKNIYKLIDKTDITDIINEEINCREIYAIIDFLIAKDSTYFVGIDWSSYSFFLYENHTYNNKKCKLLKIWGLINNKI